MNKHIEVKNKSNIHGDYIKTVLSLTYDHQNDILHVFFQNVYGSYTFTVKINKIANVDLL